MEKSVSNHEERIAQLDRALEHINNVALEHKDDILNLMTEDAKPYLSSYYDAVLKFMSIHEEYYI